MSYSPFFTSGFLTATNASSSYRFPAVDQLGPRRGSLPTDGLHTHVTSPAKVDDASAFYFTLQPTRNDKEARSFLSLDLADSHSLRSLTLVTPTQRLLSTRRPSRDSSRTVPSPKPAPSITLPSVPVQVKPTHHHPSFSLPSIESSPSSSTKSHQRSNSLHPAPSFRAGRRADALARLEGRAKSNFVSFFSDDSDEEIEPEDVILPLSPIHNRRPTTRPSTPRSSLLLKSTHNHNHHHPYTRPSLKKNKSRSSTQQDSWFPIASFVESKRSSSFNFDDDSDRWNWRSFIEVGGF